MEILHDIEFTDITDQTPHVGMEFDSLDEAWSFWVAYGGKMGFNTRKDFINQRKGGPVTSRGFVCSNEGRREKRSYEVKRPRAHTRTGCPVRFSLKLVRQTQKYRVHDFCGDHNHILQLPEAVRLMPSQRKISEPHGVIIDLADDSGINPREAYELMGREAGCRENLPFTKIDHKNRLRDNRKRNLACGQAASMLRYFYNQTLENGSFKHIEKYDEMGQITSVFWADAKMLIDYAHFGDVITFDTTYCTNKGFRPLGVFVGFNHFREITVFGAALLIDESVDTFKWLFEIFLHTHNNKHPKTIFTDQDRAMANALEVIMPNTYHGLCTWHINQNALRHLRRGKKEDKEMQISGKEILKSFKACMYDYGDEEDFKSAFNSLLCKVQGMSESDDEEMMINADGVEGNKENINVDGIEGNGDNLVDKEECYNAEIGGDEDVNEKRKVDKRKKRKAGRVTWLEFIFNVKEKWAECYMKDVVTLGMRSTQLSESFNRDLKSFLKWNMDIIRFFKHFERVLVQKRNKEIDSEYEMRKKQPRVIANIPILQQAAALYTPKLFEIFQNEWELSMAAFVKSKTPGPLISEYCIGVSTFGVDTDLDKYFQVVVNHTDRTVICSCNKFKRVGVLCGHTLKVLEVLDVKLIPEKYILQRWTREAKSEIVEDCNGVTIVEHPKLDSTNRYRVLSRKLLKLAARAADFEEVSQFVDDAFDILSKKVEEKIRNLSIDCADITPTHQPNLMENSTTSSVCFKERIGRKSGKRLENWVQKLTKKKGKLVNAKGQNGHNIPENEIQHQTCKEVETSDPFIPVLSAEYEEYRYLNSYLKHLQGGLGDALPPFCDYMEDASISQDIAPAIDQGPSLMFDEFLMPTAS